MSSYKISVQDKKDLDKFTKFLALKSAQIIVQSRQGTKFETKCKPQTSGIDWFNLSIQDLSHVSDATKKAFNGEIISTAKLPLCVEISLRTIDGDEMVLETWTLGVLPDQCDPALKVMCTVYYRMGILLKSLISVTRITPAYKLSRRQTSDSYAIFYHIYTGDPDTKTLGEGFKQVRVGQLCTPVGTIYMTLAYRTKMTISPTNVQRENSMMVKSDHFHSDLSPKHVRYKQNKKDCKERKAVNLDKPLKAGAFVDAKKIKQIAETDFALPEEPPLSWILENVKKPNPQSNGTDVEILNGIHPKEDLNGSLNNCNLNGNRLQSDEITSTPAVEVPSRRSSLFPHIGAEEEKVLQILTCPFAEGSPINDLAQFYKDMCNAPELPDRMKEQKGSDTSLEDRSVIGDSTGSSDITDLTKQLELFETSLPEFDNIVSSMCHSSNSN